jgi:hypothetical protein
VLAVLAVGLLVKLQPSPAPLTLPRGAARPPSGPVNGAWGIKGPGGFGFLGSLADHGMAEFLIVLHRGGTGVPAGRKGPLALQTGPFAADVRRLTRRAFGREVA